MTDYVLIIDDDPNIRDVLTQMLNFMGIPSSAASNGIHALEMIEKQKPVLIFLDMMMPEMSGFQLLSLIQVDSGTKHIPVIILSAIASDQMMRMPGVVRAMRKSDIDLAQLRTLIEDILSSTQGSTFKAWYQEE